ncbi:MAG: LamG domain-containing protein [Planctomycetota bacterium]
MSTHSTCLRLLLAPIALAMLTAATATAEEGLVVHLKFDEVSPDGKTTPDASGQGHDGQVHGQPLVEGVVGKAMKFEGYPEQIVELGDLKLKAPATVAFWLKTRNLANDRRILSQLDGPSSQAGSIRLMGQLDIWPGEGEWQGAVTRNFRHDAWMHLAVVFDAKGNATGHLNGQAQETVACGFDFAGVRVAIGAKFLGEHGAVFTGLLDDFRLYSRALSAEELAGLSKAAGADK